MSKHLRSALLDLIWAHNLDAMQATYRKHQESQLTAHEAEVVAKLFNELVHIRALENHHT
jgi:hypothetical protein